MSRSRRPRSSRRPDRASGDARPTGARPPLLRGRLRVVAGAVGVVAVVVYLPALVNGFTNWDDPGYVVDNPNLSPFDARFVAWAFTTLRQGNWHPLTWLSLGLDRALYGLAPRGYHLSSVLLHAVTSAAVVVLAGRLFFRAPRSGRGDRRAEEGEPEGERGALVAAGAVGLIFALHPLHVESVAWVSERKDVLCGAFYVLAILEYLQYLQVTPQQRRARYVTSLGLFALALLAKPMAVSLPLVLLVLDAHPLGRLTRSRRTRVVLEKVPFAALGAASALVTLVAQWRSGAVIEMGHLGLGQRLWIAERAVGFYLVKMILPIDLSPVYPLEASFSPLRWDFLLSLALLLAISVVAVLVRRRTPAPGAAWAAFLIMLLPVVGLVQVGQQAAADRYMYLPMLPPGIAVGAAIARWWPRPPTRRARETALGVAALVTLAGLATLTVRQIRVWRDTPTLWSWVIEKQPGAAIAHYNLGEHLRSQGDLEGARRAWQRAAALEPSFSWPLNQLANLAVLDGALDEAHDYYERATRANRYDAMSQYNFATFLDERGRLAEARTHYELFLQFVPPKLAYLIPEVQARLSQLPHPSQGPQD